MPTVTSVSPSFGPAAGGYWVTISGSEFGGVNTTDRFAYVNEGQCLNVTWISHQQIKVIYLFIYNKHTHVKI